MSKTITLIWLVCSVLADFNSHVYSQRFAESQRLLSEALPLIPKLQERTEPITKFTNIDGHWNITNVIETCNPDGCHIDGINGFYDTSGLSFASFAIVDYELDVNSLYNNKTPDFSVEFAKDKDFSLHIDEEREELTMNLRKSEKSLFTFPALSDLHISLELIDDVYADESVVIEVVAPIHGNLDKPDFIRYSDKGEPYLVFDSLSKNFTSQAPKVTCRRKQFGYVQSELAYPASISIQKLIGNEFDLQLHLESPCLGQHGDWVPSADVYLKQSSGLDWVSPVSLYAIMLTVMSVLVAQVVAQQRQLMLTADGVRGQEGNDLDYLNDQMNSPIVYFMVYSYSFAALLVHFTLLVMSTWKIGPLNLILLPAFLTCVYCHYQISLSYEYIMKKAVIPENEFPRRTIRRMMQWLNIAAYATGFVIFWLLPYLILNFYWVSIFFFGLLWIPQIVQNFQGVEAAMVSAFTPSFLFGITVYWMWFPLVLRAGSPLTFLFDIQSHVYYSPFGPLSLRPWPLYTRYTSYLIALEIAILLFQRFIANPLALHRFAHSLPQYCCLRRPLLRLIMHFIVRYSGNAYRYYHAFREKKRVEVSVVSQEEQNLIAMTSDNDISVDAVMDADGGVYQPSEPQLLEIKEEVKVDPLPAADDDCVICLGKLDTVPFSDNEIPRKARGYFETPCMHRYHPLCLTRWIRSKRTCPTCRQPVPVIQYTDSREIDLKDLTDDNDS